MKINKNAIPYIYGNMPIPGGGYVTGFVFHRKVPNILYARTDIGGTYRYDFEKDCWNSLSLNATQQDLCEVSPIALALDDTHPNYLYMVCGQGGGDPKPNGWFCVSEDYGEHFTRYPLPCSAHGNTPGRGTGTRLVVAPGNSDIIYFASQSAGLIRSTDRGRTWEILSVRSTGLPKNETNLTFVFVAPNSSTIVVGTNGSANRVSDETRGHSLYVSYNGGTSFSPLWQPKIFPGNYTPLMGYAAHRYDFDGRYLYVTMNQTGNGSWLSWEAYSCDGGSMIAGKVIRYEYINGQITHPTDITPDFPECGLDKKSFAHSGFGGITSCPQVPGLLYVSTISCCLGDRIFESRDYGDTWSVKLSGLTTGNIHFRTSYMKPEYNGGGSLVHWMSDIKCNPFDADMLVVNTGTGVFMGHDLQNPNWYFTDHCTGIEETVHLNVYAPTGGHTMVLDIVGDLGGFAFTEEGVPCENSFSDEEKNRYITCINADYTDEKPNTMIATPRGNWTGKTKGGLLVSRDGFQSNFRPELPWGLSPELDQSLEVICLPNNNSGWAALASDGQSLVWAVASGSSLPCGQLVYSNDLGQHYALSTVYNLKGKRIRDIGVKPMSDRVDPNLFYGFGPDSRLFVSTDAGKTFYEKPKPKNLPAQWLCGIEGGNPVKIQGVAGSVGTFYLAMNTDGLRILTYDKEADSFSARQVTPNGSSVYTVGLGILPGALDYIHSPKAIYITGILDGTYGFFRSYDGGETWSRINDDAHSYGYICAIDGDKQLPGRFFLATGSHGLLYGREA